MTHETHTPLPWRIVPQTDAARFAIYDNEDFHVLKINGGVVPTDANAAFIVRACNAHADLATAAALAVLVLREHVQYDDEDDEPSAEAEALEALIAALAKARGEA